MRRQAGRPSIQSTFDGRCNPALSTAPRQLRTDPSTTDAVNAFAEELGRLLARRLLADTDRRKGYSLIELLWGAAVMALLVSLAARSFGW